jgi:hypothetical protein
MRGRCIRALSGAALVAAAALAAAAPAQAAFPGRNGKLAVAFFDDPGGGAGPFSSGIALLDPTRGPAQERSEIVACTDDRRPPRDCLPDYASPAFSPNGRLIAFDAGSRIAIVRVNGSGLRLLPKAGTDPGSPVFSPNGRRIAFDAARRAGPRAVRDLYAVAADGSSRPKRIVRNAADASWSVDGLLAFERPSNATPPTPLRIWVSRPDGTRARAISSGTATRPDLSRDPDFSPDGSRVLYFSAPRDRLMVVRTDGRGQRRLAAATNAAQLPAWSPDGRRIAWWWGGIYVARADGTGARLIARDRMGPMSSFYFFTTAPSWQPLKPFR